MLTTFNFLRQKQSLILLMYYNRVEVYLWTKKSLELVRECSQEPDEGFTEFLQQYKGNPVLIVTDYLEESFRHDTGVHVQGSDRSALLERKLNYSFRNTPYRSASIIGRELEGRKDDKILLSALTKPEMLEPWVSLLLENRMYIQSLTSVAYLMQTYSQKAGLNDKNLMVVSIEEGSELRQTFLRNGKIQFSRLTSLTTKETASLPDAINHESLQIRQYLERIKLLSFDSQMVIRVFSPLEIDKDALERNNNELNTFECYDIKELANSYALTIDGLEKSATTLFLGRILQRSQMENVYAPMPAQKFFQMHRLANGLKITGMALVVITLFFKAFTLIDTFGNWSLVDNLRQQTAPLNSQYNLLTQSFPDTPIPSSEMALVVLTTEKINNNSYFLNNALSLVSQALVMAPDLQLTTINWEMATREPSEEEIQTGQFIPGVSDQYPVGQEIQSATLINMTQVNIEIEGLASSPQSYRAAQDQVVDFMSALEDIPGVTVTSSRLPTDVRVDSDVSALVDNDALRSPFTLGLKVVKVEEEQ